MSISHFERESDGRLIQCPRFLSRKRPLLEKSLVSLEIGTTTLSSMAFLLHRKAVSTLVPEQSGPQTSHLHRETFIVLWMYSNEGLFRARFSPLPSLWRGSSLGCHLVSVVTSGLYPCICYTFHKPFAGIHRKCKHLEYSITRLPLHTARITRNTMFRSGFFAYTYEHARAATGH